MGKLLDHHLDCKTCGTIRLEIPEGATGQTPVHCTTCHGYLGTWGELKEDFHQQSRAGPGVFDLHDGQIEKN